MRSKNEGTEEEKNKILFSPNKNTAGAEKYSTSTQQDTEKEIQIFHRDVKIPYGTHLH